MNQKIEKRKYMAVTMKLISPLAVSSGENLHSDADVQRNGTGEIFVPGTSLAGAFRNILEDYGCSESVMGYSEGSLGRMSSLCISDLYFEKQKKEEITVSVRDRVKLNGGKTVDNKFETEIVEPGIIGTLFLNYVQRENNPTDGDETKKDETKQDQTEDGPVDYDGAVSTILKEIQSGAIRIGANKNRGFGRFQVLEVYEKEFREKNVEKWISFVPRAKDCLAYGEGLSYEDWVAKPKKEKTKMELDDKSGYLKIRVPLHLTGGISIRRYSTKPEMTDFEHITCGRDEEGKPIPVIPGTSWSGAIRSGALSILTELVGKEKAVCLIRGWFGHVKEKEDRKAGEWNAWQSTVVIGESRLAGGTWKVMTRNQINRFDASTKTGGLYSEYTYFGGNTVLELMVRKNEKDDYKPLTGLLLMVIHELQNGYLSVGGQTAIGRGIFAKRGELTINTGESGKEGDTEKSYNESLYHYLYEGGAGKWIGKS